MLTDPVFLIAVGRLLIGGVFVFAGLRNIANFQTLEGIIGRRGVPWPKAALAFGILLQVLAGGLVMAGVWLVPAAAALLLFLVLASLMFHNFWDHEGIDRSNRINSLAGNVALAGGFLFVMAM
ncbi:DoxX family protein [Aquamicrobium sp. LC103]|uniref:DoxX family protein n=1 Tax=Aquamicrobium sp. LC103 TaxID=1120658 RepID=UPI00063E7272|nr:DoxX family protein [Aquamicrobium sp. LC103]TKT80220.1 DoxX family protein [Aquamicrobium sp. LC103]